MRPSTVTAAPGSTHEVNDDRIVGGIWGGRRLLTPAGETTRPTSEKVRAALASSLTAAGGLDGARVLDLYAGSGALGLELVSRGAASAVFVERDRAALTALRANVAALGGRRPGPVSAELTVVPGESPRSPPALPARPVRRRGRRPALRPVRPTSCSACSLALHGAGMLAAARRPGRRTRPRSPANRPGRSRWKASATRKYGDTLLCYGRAP